MEYLCETRYYLSRLFVLGKHESCKNHQLTKATPSAYDIFLFPFLFEGTNADRRLAWKDQQTNGGSQAH